MAIYITCRPCQRSGLGVLTPWPMPFTVLVAIPSLVDEKLNTLVPVGPQMHGHIARTAARKKRTSVLRAKMKEFEFKNAPPHPHTHTYTPDAPWAFSPSTFCSHSCRFWRGTCSRNGSNKCHLCDAAASLARGQTRHATAPWNRCHVYCI